MTALIRFCCVEILRCSDPQVWPTMRNGLQGFQDRDSSPKVRAPLSLMGSTPRGVVLPQLDGPLRFPTSTFDLAKPRVLALSF